MSTPNENSAAPDFQDALCIQGGALKSLGDGRIGGYLAAWGSPRDTDVVGDYFTSDTDFMLDRYPIKGHALVMFEHAQDGTLKGRAIGEFSDVRKDDVGLWAEAVIDRANAYAAKLEELLKKKPGLLGWSSGSIPQFVVNERGHIRRWPVAEGSITASPAQPFKTQIQPVKSLTFKSLIELLAEEDSGTGSDVNGTGEHQKSDSYPLKEDAMSKKNSAAIIEAVAQQFPDATAEQISAIVASVEGASAPADMEAVNAASPDDLATDVYDEAKATPVQKAAARIAIAAQKAIQAEVQKQAAKFGGYAKHAAVSANPYANGTKAQASGSNGGESSAQKSAPWADNGAPQYVPNIALKSRIAKIDPKVASLVTDIDRMLNPRVERIVFEHPAQKALLMQHIADHALERATKGLLELTDAQERGFTAIKSMKANELDNTGQSSYGAEFVPEVWTADMWDHAFQTNTVMPYINRFPMTAISMKRPVRGSRSTVSYVPEPTDDTDGDWSGSTVPSSKIGTSNQDWDAKELAVRIPFSTRLEMSAIVDWATFAVKTATQDFERTLDHIVLMGDNEAGTTNINYDGGTPSSTLQYLIFDGIGLDGLANGVDALGAAVTLDNVREARFSLNREFSGALEDIVFFVGPEMFRRLLDVDPLLTDEKNIQGGTARTGRVGLIDGMRVVSTPVIQLAAADGKITYNAAGTLARGIVAHVPSYEFGFWKNITTYPATSSDGRVKQITMNAFCDFKNSGQTLRASMIYNSLA